MCFLSCVSCRDAYIQLRTLAIPSWQLTSFLSDFFQRFLKEIPSSDFTLYTPINHESDTGEINVEGDNKGGETHNVIAF